MSKGGCNTVPGVAVRNHVLVHNALYMRLRVLACLLPVPLLPPTPQGSRPPLPRPTWIILASPNGRSWPGRSDPCASYSSLKAKQCSSISLDECSAWGRGRGSAGMGGKMGFGAARGWKED